MIAGGGIELAGEGGGWSLVWRFFAGCGLGVFGVVGFF